VRYSAFTSACIPTGLDLIFAATVNIGYRSGLKSGNSFRLSTVPFVVSEPTGRRDMDQDFIVIHVDAIIRSTNAEIV
jgi:hypothetical protein